MNSGIYMDGKKFFETEFKTEEDFETLVKINHKTLFGQKTIYLDIKNKIEAKALGGAIPDGFLFDFSDKEDPKFYLVEVELEKHDFYRHIFPQITKFFAFFKNSASVDNLTEKLFELVKKNSKIEEEFRLYSEKKEIYKTLKDIIQNSQNILLIIDGEKNELKEAVDIYTDTWGKLVKVEILKVYELDKKYIFALTPDYENIEFEDVLQENDGNKEVYTEEFHLENAASEQIRSIYQKVKTEILKLDASVLINPQRYYISLRKNRNFAFITIKRKKVRIVVMLPYEIGEKLIKKHKIAMLSDGVQRFYNGSCFEVILENQDDLEEVMKAVEEAYNKQKEK